MSDQHTESRHFQDTLPPPAAIENRERHLGVSVWLLNHCQGRLGHTEVETDRIRSNVRAILLPNDADVSYRVSILLTKGGDVRRANQFSQVYYALAVPPLESEVGMMTPHR